MNQEQIYYNSLILYYNYPTLLYEKIIVCQKYFMTIILWQTYFMTNTFYGNIFYNRNYFYDKLIL